MATSTFAQLPESRLTVPYLRCRNALVQLALALIPLPATPFNRFFYRPIFRCITPCIHVLFFMFCTFVKFEQLYNNLVFRCHSFYNNFLVKFCLPLLLYYAVFSFVIFTLAAIIRQLTNFVVSFFVFPFVVLSSLLSLFSCFHFSHFLAVCFALIFVLFLW